MSGLETVVRPFSTTDVTPQPFHTPGAVGAPDVRVAIGVKGGTKTFSTSSSGSESYKMGNVHKEKAPKSQALQNKLQGAGKAGATPAG